MISAELLILGGIAGFTIFLGLPFAVINVSASTRGFLNSLAIGILVFLIWDVLTGAWNSVETAVSAAFDGGGSWSVAGGDLFAMFGGVAIGLLGLAVYEKRYLWKTGGDQSVGISGSRLASMIALGIGAHNLSEGLAIGQSYAAGAVGLAVVLIVGFGAHNATEGFGIMAPITGLAKRPKVSFLSRLLLVGGAPTFIGTLVGSVFFSALAYILFLAMAGGSLVYVTMAMYYAGRKQATNYVLMFGIFFGLVAGFVTDLVVSLGGV